MKNNVILSPEQEKFRTMINDYPRVSIFWDWQIREIDFYLWERDKNTLSLQEKILAQFFISIWTKSNKWDFDFTEAGLYLNKKERQLIANWILEPFWP
ncbi:hypothetical protein HGO23_14740 [Xenorhabdus budapestensis]|uniref:Uncharacterized protein n=1 Tax=Xenorhabdus budapestensis TaxID=290110 RepID=A0ABX7VEE7_XENBU|nr:hypothetical protein [Xenorhabdus budapestensis]QTL39098.1 hypothetical protein HGO23_14740 [Xenorhabdus budapestensis]